MIHRPRVRFRAAVLAWSLLLCAMAGACEGSGGPGGVWDVPEVDRQIIMPWLLCTDCIDGELDHVVKRGRRLIPYLATAVRDGPTRHEDSLSQMRANEAYARLLSYRGRRGVVTQADSLALQSVVVAQKDAFLLKYRLRAAEALARLDSTRAALSVKAFCQANPDILARNPQYLTSFRAIGSCF